jgi:hypothetical protein
MGEGPERRMSRVCVWSEWVGEEMLVDGELAMELPRGVEVEVELWAREALRALASLMRLARRITAVVWFWKMSSLVSG